MPKPINPAIGSCPCSFKGCGDSAEVKKEKGKRRRLYLVCPSHGVINVGGQAFQNYILENANLPGPGDSVPEKANPLHTDIEIANEPRPNIEQGPAPEPYPQGVVLEPSRPAKPEPVKQHPGPVRPHTKHKPEKTARRSGFLSSLGKALEEV